MKKLFLIFCFLFIATRIILAQSGLTFSEVMFAPQSGTSEFIEIYNLSDSAIDLTGYQIKYYTAGNDKIIAAGNELMLTSHSFAVIFENDYDINNGTYKGLIPASALVLKISDNAFGSTGMSNSSDRTLVFLDEKGDTVDIYTYSANNTSGYSDEKIYLTNDNSTLNWSNSKSLNGTPGSQNTVTPLNYDLSVTKFESERDYEILGSEIKFKAIVKNRGIAVSKDFQLNVFTDVNKDSIAENSEIFNSFQSGSLQPGDSTVFQFSTNSFSLGKNIFIAKVETSEDENLTNNTAYYNVSGINVNETRNDIVINEIMYAPDSPQPEWIEIYNNSDKVINLEGYKIADNSDTLLAVAKSIMFNPDDFLVISSDSTISNFYNINSSVISAHISTLNNSGDKVILLDSLNRVIDSLQYYSEWGGTNGYSLERISYNNSSTDNTNWRSSLDENKATPGAKNSATDLISYKGTPVVINEIMSDPGPSKCEFIELYNISSDKINLGGWTIDDGSGNIIPVSLVNGNLESNSFFVISADSSIINNYSIDDLTNINIVNSSLSLSTKEDIIVLKDALENTVDSLRYFESWHNPNFITTQGKSLEKINPYLLGNTSDNWSTSADVRGATPRKQNSIYTIAVNSQSKISVSPNPFSPDNDGFEDFTIIHYTLTQKIAQVRIKIFDSLGRLVRTLENNMASGSEGSIVFDGLDDNNNPLRIGIYIVLIEAINQNNGTTEKMKTAIVVAKKF